MGAYLAIGVGFVSGGLWMALRPDKPSNVFWGWFGVVFFGLGAAIFAWLLVRPQVLRLTPDGLVLEGGLRRTPMYLDWADIDRFFVDRGPRGVKMIRFNYRPGHAPPGRMTKIARAFGADGGLPTAWTVSPEVLVAMLNEYCGRPAVVVPSAAPAQPQIVS
jgi:hypothetical protein